MNYFLLLFLLLFTTASFAQEGKTQEHERTIRKQNKIKAKRTFDLRGEKKVLRFYEKFDKEGRLIFRAELSASGDTLETMRYVYDPQNKWTRSWRKCKTPCRYWIWESNYENGMLMNDKGFGRDSTLLISTDYFYDAEKKLTHYYSAEKKEHGYTTLYQENGETFAIDTSYLIQVYDTTFVYHSGDTVTYTSTPERQPDSWISKYNSDGFLLESAELLEDGSRLQTETYEYDARKNKTAWLVRDTEGILYIKEIFRYDNRGLCIASDYYQDDLENPRGQSAYTYETY